jgi:glycosyltransferase involved in cell wall biosynthesis
VIRALHLNSSTSWGGLEQYTLYMVQRFRERGVDARLVALPGTPLARAARDAGVPLLAARRHAHLSPADIATVRRACAAARAEGARPLVHSHTRIDAWTGSLACLGTRVPHVHSLHMVPGRKRDPLHRVIYGRVDAIANTGETHVRNLPVRFPIPASRVHLVRHMRDPARFRFDPAARARWRADWGVRDDEVVVGAVSRIDPGKGIREFTESVDHLQAAHRARVRLVVVGAPSAKGIAPDGSPIPEPASVALDQWLTVRAADPANRLVKRPFTTDVAGVLSACDAFVLATYGEMYALSVLEAMQVGLPVIGTDAGGTPDQLADGRGLLVAPRSAEAIARGIARLLDDPVAAAAMARRGHEWAVREFDPARVMDDWLALYEEADGRRR